jgi:hypothetical protein
MRLEGLGQTKKASGLIGNRNRDLPARSIVPQPTTLSRAPGAAISTLGPTVKMEATYTSVALCRN